MEMLRFCTVGSVDDGKSTLIGRMLYDAKSIFEDQWDAVELASKNRGDSYTDLALLTDGLRAEREQGITIDVAYRYFATPRRKFIIADTPGHVQYTRNMVTGASTADLALILIDARHGIVEQSRRHTFIASLLGIPHLVVCVNKMDLVDWDQATFDQIRDEFSRFASRLRGAEVTFIPVSALEGDNVVDHSQRMPWYQGDTLLHHLEEVRVDGDRNFTDLRFPIQYVIRPMNGDHHDYRGYAGTVAGGVMCTGDEVSVLPSGLTSRIAAIETLDGPLEQAVPPMAVTIRLEDDLDVSRGDMICGPTKQAHATQDIEATLCWMTGTHSLRPGAKYTIKHTTRSARALVGNLCHRIDINTLRHDPRSTELKLNEIGRVRLRTTSPLFSDDYRHNRETGSFILIDEQTNATVAAGMIHAAPH
jgi:sulfate adenylyltransferase subunit 1